MALPESESRTGQSEVSYASSSHRLLQVRYPPVADMRTSLQFGIGDNSVTNRNRGGGDEGMQKPNRLLACLVACVSISGCADSQANAVDRSCGLRGLERAFFRIEISDLDRPSFIAVTNRADWIKSLGLPPPFLLSRLTIGWENPNVRIGTVSQFAAGAHIRSPRFDSGSFVAYEGPDSDIVLRSERTVAHCSTNESYSRLRSCRFDVNSGRGLYFTTAAVRGREIDRLRQIEQRAAHIASVVAQHCAH